jgi:hypothetical protein
VPVSHAEEDVGTLNTIGASVSFVVVGATVVGGRG